MSDYDYDSYDSYDSYDDDGFMYGADYDAVEHMTRDPVGFQMHGYGGFGYDTSHVRPDEVPPELTRSAKEGDVASARMIVEKAAAVSDEKKNAVVNHARRWTEVDYRMSGFTKEYEWFDLTALATAASKGHHDIVQYLLEQGADPTLKGCPWEDDHLNALMAAEKLLQKSKNTAGGSKSAGDDGLMLRCSQRCVDLLQAAKPFWKDATYSSSQYSNKREKFTNTPTDLEGLLRAVGSVPAMDEVPPRAITSKRGAAKTKAGKKIAANYDSKENIINGTTSGNATGGQHQRLCSRCNAYKPTGSYTKNQRAKGAAAKCKDCVNGLNAAQQQPKKKAQKKARNSKDFELALKIDDDIESIRENAKYRILEMRENVAAVSRMRQCVQEHTKASASLLDVVEQLASATDRAQCAMKEMVRLAREMEDNALEEGVLPEF